MRNVARILYVMGFAGAGKTTFVGNFSMYLEQRGYSVARVNLDPGVRTLPYNPDYDVRNVVTLEEIMDRESLGPNGGLLRSIEYIVDHIDVVTRNIWELGDSVDWILIDTTGQLELFAFRDLGEKMVQELGRMPSIGLFLFDATTISAPSGMVIAQLVAMAVQLKLSMDVVTVINKVDIADDALKKYIFVLYNDPESFKQMLMKRDAGTLAGMSYDILDVIKEYYSPSRMIAISARAGDGFDDVFDIIHEIFCVCGDLT